MKKIMIIGHAGHGKDTVAGLLEQHYGYRLVPATEYAAKTFIYPELKAEKGYKSLKECMADRKNMRAWWYGRIRRYTRDDPARLIREVMRESDIYVGCRDFGEFTAARGEGLFDLAIWVDRSEKVPPEPASSNKMSPLMANVVLDNNGDMAGLLGNLKTLAEKYGL